MRVMQGKLIGVLLSKRYCRNIHGKSFFGKFEKVGFSA
jgi:hypothetical protein